MSDSLIFNSEPLIEMFIFESNQLIEQLEEILLISEKSNTISQNNINEIFRIMHTIKGSASMMMYNNISSVSHGIEDLFHFIREGKSTNINHSSVCDIVLSSIDFIKSEIAKIMNGLEPDGVGSDILDKIHRLLAVLKEKDIENKEYSINTEIKFTNTECSCLNSYCAKVFFEKDCHMENVRAFGIIHRLKDVCIEIYSRPKNILDDNLSSDYIIQNGFDVYFSTDRSHEEVQSFFDEALFVKSYELTQVESYEDMVSDLKEMAENPCKNIIQECTSQETDSLNKNVKQGIISVNVSKLDKLMDMVGEIVITESMVLSNPDLEGLNLENFDKAAQQLRKLTDELQDIVMSIRMIPVAATFHKMHRIVRDMSKKLNKEVELFILGEETEVDKNIIDSLSDPLMHLIRNAMDHGIERRIDRELVGKPPIGKITLEARNTGGDVIITISDDGKGLDREKILKKARENNLVYKEDNELSDREVFSYILLPGFSTKEEITEFSGRGVGMDVVKRNIEKVGGGIFIESEANKGTSVNIRIPLTLAIVDGMQITVGKSIYTIPIISIKECFKANEKDLHIDTMGNEMIMIRGNCYPVLRLHKKYKLKPDFEKLTDGIMIMVEGDGKIICLYADKLLGEQQVVVKPLPNYLSQYSVIESGIAGCTILGNGTISLIIDVIGTVNKLI